MPADSSIHQGFEAAWRTRFEEFAEVADDDAGIAGWSPTGLDARVRRFVALWAPPPKPGRWLDAGCGAGTYSRILSRNGLDVVGADYSFPSLMKARRRSDDPVMFTVADVRRLPFRSGTFDGVLCFGVIQALSGSEEVVKSLGSLIRPGGQFWVDALNRWCVVHLFDALRRRLSGREKHLRYESPRDMTRLMRVAGLNNVRLHWLPILPARLQRFQGRVESAAAQWVFRFVPLVGLLFCHSFIVSGERPSSRPQA